MKAKILIVDDDPLNLSTFEAFLADNGYALHFATNGHDALTAAAALQPDLILLDVMMPALDGFDVCRRLRRDAKLGRVPIIMITALDDERSRLEGFNAGADDFLTKPCSRNELRARVRTIVSLNRFRAIAEQRERFQQLYELAPAAIVLVSERGLILAANPLAETLLAVSPSPAAERDTIFAHFDPAPADRVRAAIQAALNGLAGPPFEVRCGRGATVRVFNLRAAAVREGPERRAMLVFADITAEVQAREAIENMNRELDHVVRVRTQQLEEANGLLMSYANFVSHDLRSPLTVMKGFLSMIQEGLVPINAEARSVVDQAYKGTLLMQELLQNILQLAQDEHAGGHAGPAPITDPRPVLNRLIGHMRALYPRPAPEFVIGDLPPVGVNPVLLERVFYNLLTNALKYSAQRPRPRVEIGGHASPQGPVLFVRDNGVGFNARDADKLFQEFSRLPTAGRRDGFGLGLSLVARLLRLHEGRIWAESSEGEGATFYVQLPAPGVPPTDLEAPEITALAPHA